MKKYNTIINNPILLAFFASFSTVASTDFSEQVALEGGTKQEVEFAEYLEVNANSNLNDLFNAAMAMPGGAKSLAGELLPTGDGAAVVDSLNSTLLTQQVIEQRAFTLRNEDLSGNFNFGWNMWASAIGGSSSTDNDYGTDNIDTDMYGAMFGFDKYLIAEQAYIGYSAAYVHSDSAVDGSDKDVESDKYQFYMYGGWTKNNFFLDTAFNIGRTNAKSKRSIGAWTNFEGSTEAKADYSILEGGIKVVGGYLFETQYLNIRPSIGYNTQWISQEDYSERGSDASLRYDREDYNPSFVQLSLDLYKNYESSFGVITPRFNFTYLEDVNSERIHENVQLALTDPKDDEFTSIDGAVVGGDRYNTSLSITLENNHLWAFNARVSYDYGEYINSVSGMLNVTKRF